MHLAGTDSYHIYLVLLSFIIALLTLYTCLNLVRKVAASSALYQKLWIAYSAVTMGVGMWSMHFIAMLAYPLPIGVTYNIRTLVISIVVAVIGTLVGFFMMFRSKLKLPEMMIGGTFMGLSIGGMHYIGMGALNNVDIRYAPVPFTLSIVIAIFASITALYLTSNRNQRFIISGLIMGIAITGMHYMGMAAVVITYPETFYPSSEQAARTDDFVLAMYVAFGTIVILSAGVISSLKTDQRLAEQIALKASILDSSIDCMMMFNCRGWMIEFNPAAEATFGYSRKQALSLTLLDFLFPFNQDGQAAASLFRLLARKDDSIIGKRVEMMAYRADRTVFPAEITITGIQFEGKHIYSVYLRDLTEKKKIEDNKKEKLPLFA